MADTRRTIIIVAAVVLGLAVIGGILEATGAPEELTFVFLTPFGLIFNPITLIILLIVFLSRRNRQQQQQQVVVVTGQAPQADGPKLRCPKCKGLSIHTAAFCGHCGQKF